MAKVTIHFPRTPVTKGSSGLASATLPNVCKLPGPPAPFVPTPLPNIGRSGDSPKGYSKTVTIEDQPVAITGASFGSQGDSASQGTGGGLISSNTHGPTKFIGPGAMNVQIEGKNVQLLGDPMLNNCGPSGGPANAATMTGILQAPGGMMVIYGDDTPCGRCGKMHPLEAGAETLEMMRTLLKAVRKAFEAQKEQIRELSEANANLKSKRRRLKDLQLKREKRGLPLAEKHELAALPGEISELEANIEALDCFFETNAVLRWDNVNNTFFRGYMLGVMLCVCKSKKLAACSGNAPPALESSLSSAGFECASPPVVHRDSSETDEWPCAARQIMERIRGHRPKQLIERWFSPVVKGLKPGKGPQISFQALVEDPVTKMLTVEERTQRFKTGENVPSCSKCQERLAALYCDTKCG
jgi:hypothetical protein